MKRIPTLILTLLLVAACNADSPLERDDAPLTNQATPSSDTQTPKPQEPHIENGVQVIEIEAGEAGFAPVSISLQIDIPARLVFTRTTEQTCATEVSIPGFDIDPVELPLEEAVAVEFTPTETGDFRFACGMDMQEGTLLVQS